MSRMVTPNMLKIPKFKSRKKHDFRKNDKSPPRLLEKSFCAAAGKLNK
jgi:hypothetical protein